MPSEPSTVEGRVGHTPGVKEESPAFTAEHLVNLTGIGIDRELVVAAGVRSVTGQEAREAGFKLSLASDLSGIVFPFYDPETGHCVTARLTRNHPDTDSEDKCFRLPTPETENDER